MRREWLLQLLIVILSVLVGVLLMLCVWFVVKKKKAFALYTKKRKLQTVDTMNLQGWREHLNYALNETNLRMAFKDTNLKRTENKSHSNLKNDKDLSSICTTREQGTFYSSKDPHLVQTPVSSHHLRPPLREFSQNRANSWAMLWKSYSLIPLLLNFWCQNKHFCLLNLARSVVFENNATISTNKYCTCIVLNSYLPSTGTYISAVSCDT